MRVVTVGLSLDYEHESIDEINFNSNITFLDYDLLIWNPNSLLQEYKYTETHDTYMGEPSLDDDHSVRLVRDIQRRTEEMKAILELGRSIVIFMPEPKRCYIATGGKKYSGTGRNRQTTRMVANLSLSEAIPLWPDTIIASGRSIEVRENGPFTSFWEKNKNCLEYSAYFKAPSGKPVFFIKGTDKAVGTYQKISNSNLIFIPSFSIPEDLEDYPETYPGEAEEVFLDSLIDLIEVLKKDTGDFELPSWSKEYILPSETEKRSNLISLEKDLEDILIQISRQKDDIAELEKNKLLLSGSGRALEIQVKKIFEELGFTAIEGLPGRDDLILEYGQKIAVVEIKGISKSAAEKHAAQLEKWTSEYYIANNVKPKGILIVNAYKDIPLRERRDAAFPNQMLDYSKKRDHCLITSQQLLSLYLDCKNDSKTKNRMIELMFNTKGTFNEYQDWTNQIHFEGETTEVLAQAD